MTPTSEPTPSFLAPPPSPPPDASAYYPQSCPGITVILILDDDDGRRKHGSSNLKRGVAGSSSASRMAVSPSDTPGGRPTSPDSGIFRNVRIVRGSGSDGMPVDGGGEGGGEGSDGGSSVDLSVVDYVLKKPFSDESFRRLLEAVEADHLQVGYNGHRQSVVLCLTGVLQEHKILLWIL